MNEIHAIRSSSLGAYQEVIVGSREDRQAQLVFDAIKSMGRCTRRMVAHRLDMETGTVSARVNKLLAGASIVETGYKKPCPITGVSVNWLQVTPQQIDLFGSLQ